MLLTSLRIKIFFPQVCHDAGHSYYEPANESLRMPIKRVATGEAAGSDVPLWAIGSRCNLRR